jgi:hypothetical protein
MKFVTANFFLNSGRCRIIRLWITRLVAVTPSLIAAACQPNRPCVDPGVNTGFNSILPQLVLMSAAAAPVKLTRLIMYTVSYRGTSKGSGGRTPGVFHCWPTSGHTQSINAIIGFMSTCNLCLQWTYRFPNNP